MSIQMLKTQNSNQQIKVMVFADTVAGREYCKNITSKVGYIYARINSDIHSYRAGMEQDFDLAFVYINAKTNTYAQYIGYLSIVYSFAMAGKTVILIGKNTSEARQMMQTFLQEKRYQSEQERMAAVRITHCIQYTTDAKMQKPEEFLLVINAIAKKILPTGTALTYTVALDRKLDDKVESKSESKIENKPENKVENKTENKTENKPEKHENLSLVSYQKGTAINCIAIGISTGGPEALATVLRSFGHNSPPTLIVQHMPAGFTGALAMRLNDLCMARVCEAKDGDILQNGHILIAPGGKHMRVKWSNKGFCIEIIDGPSVCGHKPSVNVLFDSVADVFNRSACGVIMTGLGDDGVSGLHKLRKYGAKTIAQGAIQCAVYGMPRQAIESGAAEFVAELSDLGDAIHDRRPLKLSKEYGHLAVETKKTASVQNTGFIQSAR